MNSKVGIIKEIDSVGRIVIPKEFRERLHLDKKVEVILIKEGVLIRNSEYELIRTEGSMQEK
jgi:AbrB family looped-hinge helix DNA binding protein